LQPARLSPVARSLLSDLSNELLVRSASRWEVIIKHGRGRDDFQVDTRLLRRGPLDNGCIELPIIGLHALAVGGLPALHKDPFDRILVAQAVVEGITQCGRRLIILLCGGDKGSQRRDIARAKALAAELEELRQILASGWPTAPGAGPGDWRHDDGRWMCHTGNGAAFSRSMLNRLLTLRSFTRPIRRR